jgi:hypothetical protein
MSGRPGVLIASGVLIPSSLAVQIKARVNAASSKDTRTTPLPCYGAIQWTSLLETYSTGPAGKHTSPGARLGSKRKTWPARAQSLMSSMRMASGGE